MSRRSSELFFLRTVRVRLSSRSVGLGTLDTLSTVADVPGKGMVFVVGCMTSGAGECMRESEGEAISTFIYVVSIAAAVVYGEGETGGIRAGDWSCASRQELEHGGAAPVYIEHAP